MDSDDELMRQVREGSRAAFAGIFDAYRGPIWRFFRRRVGDAARAEELAQDTFVALLQNARRYVPQSAFRAYLFGIAWHLLQAERRRIVRDGATPLDLDSLPAVGADLDAALWVREALATLDAEDRDVLMLREYDQLTYDEIAALCGLPLNTVRTRLFRARAALRDALRRDVASSGRRR
jgi:RNA polymerase sigma-70 factor, ECF subfamily